MKAQPEAQDGETPPANAMELIAHLVRHCRDCPLGGLRANAVPGTGPPDAAVMIIAEGPGEHEDRQGKPFVGPAGKFLDKLLAEAGMDRDDVFITNMIKCRAPDNRDPEDAELRACEKHLNRQLIALQPRLIIPLGKFALQRFLPGETIGKAGGRLRNMNGRFVYPVMHPAAGLRRGEFAERITADFRRIPQALQRIAEDPPPPENPAKEKPAEPRQEQSPLF